ncbi:MULTISPECIES: hypothetical protein [unclassified Thioalkalivibrio]|uniref:hypothetical protein n=1 Tax=unclassified Thioalkalivibrio TaxID=2621013 RepID=UPI00036EEA0F|nr:MULTISPECIES: hypothetical protein [unclassified Thioalkalivibrio]
MRIRVLDVTKAESDRVLLNEPVDDFCNAHLPDGGPEQRIVSARISQGTMDEYEPWLVTEAFARRLLEHLAKRKAHSDSVQPRNQHLIDTWSPGLARLNAKSMHSIADESPVSPIRNRPRL